MVIDELIEKIVELEWHAFTNVENEGGRADCQDDKNTFYIMRKSQYLCWPIELLESYQNDFLNANSKGWNLVAEKYARMEEFTSPDSYAKLVVLLPSISREQREIIDYIAKQATRWTDEFYSRNTEVAKRARPVNQDINGITSSETYLRGELATYSLETLIIYKKWIDELKRKGINLIEETVINTIKLYNKSRGER